MVKPRFIEGPKPTQPTQTAVQKTSFPPPQSTPPPGKSAMAETAVEENPPDAKPEQAAKKSPVKPVQLALPLEAGKEKSDEMEKKVVERPGGNKRRPSRPGADRRRGRRT